MAQKTKTTGALARLNKLCHEDADFMAFMNDDDDLKQFNQDMVVILGEIKAEQYGGNGSGITAPPPFPCPTARWMGRLSTDTTTKTTVGGDVRYKYNHQSAFALNAQQFRDRCNDILNYVRMENDLINKDARPNPGGLAGDHFGDSAP